MLLHIACTKLRSADLLAVIITLTRIASQFPDHLFITSGLYTFGHCGYILLLGKQNDLRHDQSLSDAGFLSCCYEESQIQLQFIDLHIAQGIVEQVKNEE